MLLKTRRPATAYELLATLQRELKRRVHPPTIYRALEFLRSHQLVARIESRNAYVACAYPERSHDCVFFVCDRCDRAQEIEDPALERLIAEEAAAAGFRLLRRVVELQGVCADCLAAPGSV